MAADLLRYYPLICSTDRAKRLQHLQPSSTSHAGTHSDQELPPREEQVPGYKNVVFLRTVSSGNCSEFHPLIRCSSHSSCGNGLAVEAVKGLVDYKTLANQCAAELLSDVLEASNITQRPKDRSEPLPSKWLLVSSLLTAVSSSFTQTVV